MTVRIQLGCSTRPPDDPVADALGDFRRRVHVGDAPVAVAGTAYLSACLKLLAVSPAQAEVIARRLLLEVEAERHLGVGE